MKKYPKSKQVDAASFYKCYALQRTTNDYGDSFDCYRQFLAAYPDSKWADDAATEYAKLAKRMAKAGDPRGKAALESLRDLDPEPAAQDDADFKLSVLYALLDSGDRDLALQSIQELLKSPDPEVRQRAVMVLSDVDDDASLDVLINVAKTDPDAEVRRHAVYAISDHGDEPKVIDAMVSIMKTDQDPDVRRHVLYAIAEVDRPDVTQILVDVALKDPDEDLRTAATYALAEVDSPDAAKALEKLAMEAPSFEMKRAALYALIERDDVNIIPLLKKLALSKEKTPEATELRRAAVYALAEVDDPSVVTVLNEVVKTSDDPEVKRAAFYALAEHGGPAAVDALKAAALDPKDGDLALAAVYGLTDVLDDSDSSFFMEVYRKSPFEEVRRAALASDDRRGRRCVGVGLGCHARDREEQRSTPHDRVGAGRHRDRRVGGDPRQSGAQRPQPRDAPHRRAGAGLDGNARGQEGAARSIERRVSETPSSASMKARVGRSTRAFVLTPRAGFASCSVPTRSLPSSRRYRRTTIQIP